jgi:hypothetical protein
MSSPGSRLRRLLEYSLFRWESAALISGTALLTALAWFFRYLPEVPNLGWLGTLAFGLFSEGILIIASVLDPATRRKVLAEEPPATPQIPPPPELSSPELRHTLDKAIEYYQRIQSALNKRGQSPLKVQLQETLGQVRDWLRTLYQLTERLDHWQRERPLLEQDRQQGERRIKELGEQLRKEDNPQVQRQLKETLGALGEQLRAIQSLEDTMEQAQLKLEHSLSALGTLYSQTLLIDAKEGSGGRVAELREEIGNEKAVLEAILGAMDAVYREGAA